MTEGHGTGAFARALQQAIERRGVSLASLSRRLAATGNGVSVSTLSYWRSGRRRPEQVGSLAAVDELERLLRLEPGHLRSRIGPSSRPGPAAQDRSLVDVMPDPAAVRRGVTALGFEDLLDPVEVETHVVLDLDAEGMARRCSTRSAWRARRSGVDRVCHVFTLGGPSVDRPVLASHHGFTPGAEWYDAETGVWLLERRLGRPLRSGEEVLLETTATLPTMPDVEPYYAHHLSRRNVAVLIWVRFHPDRVPRYCESFTQLESGEATSDHLDMTGRTSTHASFRTAGPGHAGLRWVW